MTTMALSRGLKARRRNDLWSDAGHSVIDLPRRAQRVSYITGLPIKSDQDLRWARRDASPAVDFAILQLRNLQLEHKVEGLPAASPQAVGQMVQLLRSVLAPSSVYPTMSIDDDGAVIAEWHFGPRSVEIVVDVDGTFEFVMRLRGRRRASGTSKPILRRLIRDVSRHIEQANPAWRALFPQVHSHEL